MDDTHEFGARPNLGIDPTLRSTQSDSPETVLGLISSPTLQDVSTADSGPHSDEPRSVPPSWSELRTKAGKERKRLPLACIACRRKKIRCSGDKPACVHCLRSRIPCVYKVTARKAAPRTDYMAMLDKRLKRMEERVIRVIPKDEQTVVSETGRAAVRPSQASPTLRRASASKKRGPEEAFGDKIPEPISGDTSGGEGPGASTVKSSAALFKVEESDEQNLLTEGADQMPPKQLQEHLAEVYFDYVYGQGYHLLHKPSFMRKLAQGTVPPVLILAVCAISARFSNHPLVRTEPTFLRGEKWASPAREIALRRYDSPSITILIVYLLLGLHEFGTCQGGRSWMFGGMATRMAYALQLHRDLKYDPRTRTGDGTKVPILSDTDREIRRRTMWACSLMDRFNSSGTERPIFVGAQYITAQLPIKEELFQMELTGPTEDLEGHVPNPVESGQGELPDAKSNMGVAAYLVRIVHLWGRLIIYVNLGGKERDKHPMWSEKSEFQNIKGAVEEWKNSLPSSLLYTEDNLRTHASQRIANQFLFLHIIYHQILVFMNRFAIPAPGSRPSFPKDMPPKFIDDACRTATDAASAISELISEARENRVVAPFAGYSAFFSSTIHVQRVFSKDPEIQAASKRHLTRNMQYLTHMKKYWGMFHFVTESLRDLYQKHAEAARSGNQANKEGSPAIFQYGDWFDRYPHGVSGADYEGPSAQPEKEAGSDAVLGQKSDLQTVEEYFSKLSPATRAARLAREPVKKGAKKRRTSRTAGGKPLSRQTSLEEQEQQMEDAQNTPEQMSTGNTLPDLQSTQVLPAQQDLGNLTASSAAFPPNFQQMSNSMLVPGPQQFVPPMDQPGTIPLLTETELNMMNIQQSMPSDMTAALDNFASPDMGNLGVDAFQGMNPAGDGFWGDSSTAWFMPFNMAPPNIEGQNAMMTGDVSWADPFAGYGGGVGLPLQQLPNLDGAGGEAASLPLEDIGRM